MFKNSKLLSNLDFSLIFTILALFTLGMISVASATDVPTSGISREVMVQFASFAIGIGFIILILRVDYNILGESYKILYVVSIILLLLVYVPGLGVERFNARSWIDIGIIDLQTSELAKIGFIISFAKYIEKNRMNKLDSLKSLVAPIAFCLPFLGLLLKQPDLGTALVFCLIIFGILYVAGLNRKVILIGVLVLAVTLPIAYNFLAPYQQNRINSFINPDDPSNYQVVQSKITIGSGKFFGRGVFGGVYHKYNFLPVKESDFIFAVASEEMGFIGGAAIIILYFNLLRRMVIISIDAKDDYGVLVSTGVTFMFAFQIMENIGMTMGIMPMTGVTLPFFSYGGSSIMTSMIGTGLLLNVNIRRKRLNF